MTARFALCLAVGPPPGLLFHPYRKPKRNRTAFSPSQLLQLEQAFEKNHYVVGQERKTLASKLQLTETQVGVLSASVCLSVCPSVRPSVRPSVCLSVCPSVRLLSLIHI